MAKSAIVLAVLVVFVPLAAAAAPPRDVLEGQWG